MIDAQLVPLHCPPKAIANLRVRFSPGGRRSCPSFSLRAPLRSACAHAFGQVDRTLINFNGGVPVQVRFGGTAANVSAMQVVSFPPTSANDRPNEMFAAIYVAAPMTACV